VSGVVYVGSDDGGIYALDAATGKVLWKTNTGGPVKSSPEVADGVVYVGSDDGGVYALDAATGLVLLKTLTGAPVRSSPDATDGVVYVGSDDKFVYALGAVASPAVPEPSTWVLLSLGFVALVAVRRAATIS